jgi:Uma2 family endonuclease
MLEYIENGLQLGWLIDSQTLKVEIYRPNQAIEILNFSTTQIPTLSGESVLPGFVLELASIFKLD